MDDHAPQKKILLAIPDSGRDEVDQFLTSKGLSVVQAPTFEEAVGIVQSQDLQGMIVVSDWLMSPDGAVSELVAKMPRDLPMLMLIRTGTDYSWIELYQPGTSPREYCTIPCGVDELNHYLMRIGIISQP